MYLLKLFIKFILLNYDRYTYEMRYTAYVQGMNKNKINTKLLIIQLKK